MADTDFRPFRLSGGRFDRFDEASTGEAGFPLEAIDELRRYERLLVEVARGLWLRDNPDRQRAPRRFSEGLRLRLTAIEAGCVVPVLAPVERADQLFPDGLLERSTSTITDAIAAVVQGDRLPTTFPESATSSLVQLGSALHADEHYILERPGASDIIRYTQASRRHLLTITAEDTITLDGELIGRIYEVHANRQTFQFTERLGTSVEGSFDRSELFTDIRGFTQPDRNATYVRLLARYSRDREGNISAIENVDDVETFVSPEDPMGSRLRQLLELPHGWHDGEGATPSAIAIEMTRDLIADLSEDDQEGFHIFPRLDGGLLVERQAGARRWTFAIEADGEALIVVVDPSKGAPVTLDPTELAELRQSLTDFLHG